jgi:hypothetical protein
MESSERNSLDVAALNIARSFHSVLKKYDSDLSRKHWDELPVSEQAILVGAVKKLLIEEIIQPGPQLVLAV